MGQLVYLDPKDLLASLEIKDPQVQKDPRADLGRVDLQDPWVCYPGIILLYPKTLWITNFLQTIFRTTGRTRCPWGTWSRGRSRS